MDTYYTAITVINLAGMFLVVGLATYQGILIKALREDIVVLALAHNGMVDYIKTELERLQPGHSKRQDG